MRRFWNIPETGQKTERPAREQDRQVRCQADDMLRSMQIVEWRGREQVIRPRMIGIKPALDRAVLAGSSG